MYDLKDLFKTIDTIINENFQNITISKECSDDLIKLNIDDFNVELQIKRNETIFNISINKLNLLNDYIDQFKDNAQKIIQKIKDLNLNFNFNLSLKIDQNNFPENTILNFDSTNISWNIQNDNFNKNLNINLNYFKKLFTYNYHCEINDNFTLKTEQQFIKKDETKELINFQIKENLTQKSRLIEIYSPEKISKQFTISSLKYSYIDLIENLIPYNKLPIDVEKLLSKSIKVIDDEDDYLNLIIYYYQVAVYLKLLDIFIFLLNQSIELCQHKFFNRSFKLQLKKLDSKKLHEKIDSKVIKNLNKNIKVIESFKNNLTPFNIENFDFSFIENRVTAAVNREIFEKEISKLDSVSNKLKDALLHMFSYFRNLIFVLKKQVEDDQLILISEYIQIKDNKIILNKTPYGYNLLNFNTIRVIIQGINNHDKKEVFPAYIDIPVSIDLSDKELKTFALDTKRDFNGEISMVQYLARRGS